MEVANPFSPAPDDRLSLYVTLLPFVEASQLAITNYVGVAGWNWGRVEVLANAAMADGSVLAALATIAGGEEVPNDW